MTRIVAILLSLWTTHTPAVVTTALAPAVSEKDATLIAARVVRILTGSDTLRTLDQLIYVPATGYTGAIRDFWSISLSNGARSWYIAVNALSGDPISFSDSLSESAAQERALAGEPPQINQQEAVAAAQHFFEVLGFACEGLRIVSGASRFRDSENHFGPPASWDVEFRSPPVAGYTHYPPGRPFRAEINPYDGSLQSFAVLPSKSPPTDLRVLLSQAAAIQIAREAYWGLTGDTPPLTPGAAELHFVFPNDAYGSRVQGPRLAWVIIFFPMERDGDPTGIQTVDWNGIANIGRAELFIDAATGEAIGGAGRFGGGAQPFPTPDEVFADLYLLPELAEQLRISREVSPGRSRLVSVLRPEGIQWSAVTEGLRDARPAIKLSASPASLHLQFRLADGSARHLAYVARDNALWVFPDNAKRVIAVHPGSELQRLFERLISR